MAIQKFSIGFVSQEYPEETGWGGIGTYTHEAAHGLAKRGHKITVISRALSSRKTYEESDGVHVYRILPSLNPGKLPFFWRLNRFWEGYRFEVSKTLGELMRKIPLDILETPDTGAELLAFQILHRKKPPVVVRLHSADRIAGVFSGRKKWRDYINHAAEIQMMRRASAISAPSEAAVSGQDPKFSLPQKPCAVIYNPVNTDLFRPVVTGSKNSLFEILYLGRMEELKGADILMQAIPEICKNIPEARITFAGAGMGKSDDAPPERMIAAWLPKELHGRVRILKRIPHEELTEIYAQAAICVVPSRWEQFGYSCAEAMASGKAVIASRAGALPELIEDGVSGILIPPADPAALAEAVGRLFKDAPLRKSLGEAARRRAVENFSYDVVLPQHETFYRNIILAKC